MKPYSVSLGAGLLVGVIYAMIGVRSPAPPIIALVDLAGMLLGEQLVPIAQRLFAGVETTRFIQQDCARHVLGRLLSNEEDGP
ncbi:MAG: XapX domain-containing protein [Croceicoccus sp.]|nr:XapX domain-containing protein [Croceicoccus sp.]|tara:strand:- start:2862 stop:3110 length:249 start_codon:yes stop_codon:yes gene_type:complete